MAKKATSIPRLKHVAEEAGVSLTAASRILRGGGEGERYALETQKRVQAAAKKIGWRRNRLVSSMQSGKTKSIGVLIPPYDSFWVEVLYGIHESLNESGYLPITVWPGGCEKLGEFDRQKEEGFGLIDDLLDRRIDGLLLWPAYAVALTEHFLEIENRTVPIGTIEHKFQRKLLGDVVESDDAAAVKSIIEHFTDLGHRRFACLSTREIAAQTWAIRRRKFFEQAIGRRAGAAFKCWRLNKGGTNGLKVARDLLTSSFKPTAIFAVSDHEAKLVYQAANELAVRIPEDVSVVGFNNLDFSASLDPGLTTIDRKPRVMGRLLVELMIARLEDPKTKASSVTVDVELVERGSTARVAESD